jgi:hypothetical protein
MTIRTTSSAVEGILLANYDGTSSLTPAMETATLLVDRVITCATRKGVTISDAEAEMLERYLAAHFYGHGDQFYTSKSTSGASGSFQGQFTEGLKSSHYGQSAMAMDPSGCLRALTTGARASATWLGKPKSSQLSAEDRGDD